MPAWFINLASPCVGVPLHTFVIATVVGHQPINFISVQVGVQLGPGRAGRVLDVC